MVENSVGADSFFLLNSIKFIDLSLVITMLQDLCALQDMPVQVSAVVQCERRPLAPV